jgi:hypothetical protein
VALLDKPLTQSPHRFVAELICYAAVVALPMIVLGPWLARWDTFGFHDWDVQTSHRHLVVESITAHGQMPWWNPYACGGFPAWGYVEGGTIVVGPWLLLYLIFDMAVALRLEVLLYALLSSAGAYFLAARFTTSFAARLLVVALWAVNGRWGLQTASGHTWHLAYAYLPWAWAFFDRAASRDGRLVDIALTGATGAMLVYAGGIYPLPHTALLLVLYAVAIAVDRRTVRPLIVLFAAALVGIGLAAPKLVPMMAVFERAPRLIESNETLSLGALWTMLTSRDQAFYARPARVHPYGWHEWGIYISTAGAGLLAAAVLLVQGRREAWLKGIGLAFVLLGFGAFHPDAPWTWLHEHVPIFRSQHVPSRFLYPAVLVLAIVAAIGLDRWLRRRRVHHPGLEPLAALCVAVIGLDVAWVARKPMADAMWMEPPAVVEAGAFHFEQHPPVHYKKRDWAGPMYLSMLAQTGVLNCYGAPPFEGRGALAHDDPRHRGEAFVLEGGEAHLASWSPNEILVEVDAVAGGTLVYNMNFDQGWAATVEGAPAPVFAHRSTLAVEVPAGQSRVTLAYRPVGLTLGLVLFGITAAGIGALAWRRRRRA